MTKPIILDDEFSITSDGKQWALRYSAKKETADKDGNVKVVTSEVEWYCGSTSTILKIYVEKSLKKSGLETLEALVKKVDALYERIDELLVSKAIVHAEIPKKLKFAVDPPESTDEEEDGLAADSFDETGIEVEDVLGDMF